MSNYTFTFFPAYYYRKDLTVQVRAFGGNNFILHAHYHKRLLRLTDISLLQFKNYQLSPFVFRERIVGICGKNGIGKTNLLDAIYYLCFTKSYFSRSDAQHVHNGTQGFRIAGDFSRKDGATSVVCILRENLKKEFVVDGDVLNRLSDHIGKFPCVMIAPDDIQIITGSSEERRRFLDALLSQLDHEYLMQLIRYNKVLQQRNGFLRSQPDFNRVDNSLLDVLNEQLEKPGTLIFEKRNAFLRGFIPMVQEFYQRISGEQYQVDIAYESQLLQTSFDNLLHQFRDKDGILQRTNAGIHKDDLNIQLNGNPFRNIASQGQRKSLLFAFKLAAFEQLKIANGFAPLLLLDDVFEKLDEARMHNLLHWVCRENDGQIFITDTHCSRLQENLGKLTVPFQMVVLE